MRKWISGLLAAMLLASLFASAALADDSGSDTGAPSVIRTTFQTQLGYTDQYDVKSDAVMVYATKAEGLAELIRSWKDRGYRVDAMISISHDWEGIYELGTLSGEPHPEVVQTRKDGSDFRHVDPRTGYVTPTQGWNDYVLDIAKRTVDEGAHAIVFEEPEYWTEAGYEGAFKSEWQAYYGEPWEDPASSEQARYKSEKLKSYLYTRSLDYISSELKAYKPGIEVWVASHSTVNYNSYGIVAANIAYYDLPGIDGFIGQAWSDTARYPIPFEGAQQERVFDSAYLEYSSLSELQTPGDGKSFYALADPKADDPNLANGWDQVESYYKQTISAQFLQPKIEKFEIMPWPSRAFVPAPMAYKTVQMNIFEASKAIHGQPYRMEAGSPGVTFLISDTMTYQRGAAPTAASEAMYGPTAPLVAKGIPVRVLPVERVSATALADTKVLVMSYDSWKPLKASYNQAIADWVKQGGVLLYLGGENSFQNVGEWWDDSGIGSPQQDLWNKLGLTISNPTAEAVAQREATLQPTAAAQAIDGGQTASIPKRYALTSYALSGDAEPLYTHDGHTVSFRQTAGQGQVIYFGASPGYFSSSDKAARLLRGLTKYALGQAGAAYAESNTMTAYRGPIVAVQSMEQPAVIPGRYIDLWDPRLGVVDDKTILAGSSALLYDIADIDTSAAPRVYFANGEITNKRETAAETVVTVSGPKDAQAAVRLGSANRYPQQVTATDAEGQPAAVRAEWENASRTLLVQFEHQSKGVTVRVDWSTQAVPDSPQQQLGEFVIRTNNGNEDAPYKGTFVGEVGSTNEFRFADGTSKMVYRLNLNEFPQGELMLELANNFTVELSPDGAAWEEILNAQAMTGHDEHNMGNRDKYAVDTEGHTAADGTIYVRIGDASTGDGWGGALFGIYVRYMQQVSPLGLSHQPDRADLTGERPAQMNVLVTNRSGQTQQVELEAIPIVQPMELVSFVPGTADESPYLIKDHQTGVNAGNFRFTDGERYAIYKFVLPEGINEPRLSLDIGNQFEIAFAKGLTIQPDDPQWALVASDWTVADRELQPVTDLGNRKVRSYDVGDYATGDRVLYVKISDSFPEDGHGALLSKAALSGERTVPLDVTATPSRFELGSAQSKVVAVTLAATDDTPAGEYRLKLKATSGAGEAVHALPVGVRQGVPSYSARQAETDIAIDGVVSAGEWDGAEEINVSPESPAVKKHGKVWGAIADGADLTSRYKIKWDAEYLYLLEQRTDNVIHFTNTGAQMYLSDATMLFLDIDRNKSGSGYRDGDFAIMVTPGGVKGAENPHVFIREGHDNGVREYAYDGGEVAAQATDGGYTLELAIPWSDLNVYPFTPKGGAAIGMSLLATDNDDQDGNAKWGQAMWAGDGDNQALWADMTFNGAERLEMTLPSELAVGASADAALQVVFSDGTVKPAAGELTFVSSDAGVAAVDAATGKVTGVKRGEAVIAVTSSRYLGLIGEFRIVIEPVLRSISIQLPSPLQAGRSDYAIVIGHYNDGIDSRITEGLAFSSEKTKVATVDADTGLIRAIKPGNSRITASVIGIDAMKATAKLLVHPAKP
ncbi:sugar-binding protein [Paenibacillus spongiae]|uniref:Carbohydrate-binding domain-containing protein n=1 Tax=Paenibacillus spongiae TaxID=2909671 RepID=A0ABY5SKB4_9BACL|nr:sugar-binding protein [Paenibacillus spongiae]UVI32955.1 hypothetical protein L1F29_14440 [Paenibacillus spongiae]